MALSTASLVAVAAAGTAAANTLTAKTTAVIPQLLDALLLEISRTTIITPNAKNHFDQIRAECVAQIADFVTALTTT